jgi:hypothetical protein
MTTFALVLPANALTRRKRCALSNEGPPLGTYVRDIMAFADQIPATYVKRGPRDVAEGDRWLADMIESQFPYGIYGIEHNEQTGAIEIRWRGSLTD